MRARAVVRTASRRRPNGRTAACITTLRSEAPLILRPTAASQLAACPTVVGAAHVCIAAGAAGPLAGDQLTFEVDVGDGSSLVLTTVSSTLALPGPGNGTSMLDVRVRVGERATLVWLARPVIAAAGCDHVNSFRIDLAPDARLVILEQAVLGRHGEPGGRLRQRIRVCQGSTPVYCQELVLGDAIAGSPVVAGDNRAVGSLLVVDPSGPGGPPSSAGGVLLSESALLRLACGARLVTALARDTVALRGMLRAGAVALGDPWDQLATAIR